MPYDSEMDSGVSDDGVAAFVSARPRLFGIAYRMLGSAAEADDIVQDVWLRWQVVDRNAVVNAAAFLATITMRLALNLAHCARACREIYVGTWLSEAAGPSTDPELGSERREALELAALMLLEKLSPRERAAYVLREAFSYPYPEIASALRLTEANTRQLVTRARKHLADGRRAPVSSAEQRRLLEAFVAAVQHGDVAALEGLFASDIVSCSDRRGFARAPRKRRACGIPPRYSSGVDIGPG